jgi:preprotein translocase subunit SecB
MKKKQPEQQILDIVSQYTKDLSFENIVSLSSLQMETEQEEPSIDIKINVDVESDKGNTHCVSLKFNIKAGMASKTIFILELDYRGNFEISGFPPEMMDLILRVECPRLLFPFARSIIASTVIEGGFPPFLLSPINFVELYQQQMDKGNQTIN